MPKTANGNGLPADLESTLWAAADKLRGHLDAAEYKHVVLGLIFLKYISDTFQELYQRLSADPLADPEDRDEYLAENAFFVPEEARWERLQQSARSADIGILIDRAMAAIESDNPLLKGVLPQDYGRADLDKRRLGELIDLISTVTVGDAESRSQDILGRVYEYFLGQFATAEGKKGGQFYTPASVVRLLVEMLEPYRGRVYDPCCGSGGMFVQSEKFIRAHGGNVGDLSVYGQESNPTTWRLCKMNLAIRGIEANLGTHPDDTFHHNLHRDLRADFVLANPPFNMSDWGGGLLTDDPRWRYGLPPTGNANYAWVQHIIHHLSSSGRAGFVLSNGSMSTNTATEGAIRRALVEADLIDCMVALPPQLFYNTQIPACLWFINRRKPDHRRGQTLFIDARALGYLVNRTLRDLTAEEIAHITATYHQWRAPALTLNPAPERGVPLGEGLAEGGYADQPGFCKSATLEEIAGHGYVLTPGRYVGAADAEDDGEPFGEKMTRLTATLSEQFAESARLEGIIRENLRRLGYE
ncbi:MAG TPA: class I SAM-dependent DNA methyltransferase [Aggregatilineales bacterium]|nr:class I SAM-dependent DNA methyltransferase [Aggregatilineales bacterium]